MELPLPLQSYLSALALDLVRLVIWLVVLVIVFVPVERLFALHRQEILRKSFLADVVYFFLSGLIPKLLMIVPMSFVAWGIHRVFPSHLYDYVAALPLWARFIAALIVGDIGFYWGHRLMHQVPYLWRFHAIHHSAEELDWLVNTKAHPFDLAFTRFCGFVLMYLLGLAQPTGNSLDTLPILAAITGVFWGFFIHANVRLRFGWLESLLSSPAFHHWHHTNDGPEVIDKNFASLLPWLDKWFGTFYLPHNHWPQKYGTHTQVPANVPGQLVRPFIQD